MNYEKYRAEISSEAAENCKFKESTLTVQNSVSSDTKSFVEGLIQDSEFEHPIIPSQPAVFLKQPAIWSRAIIWGIMGITIFGVAWASVAKVEKVIPAQGKLEPQAAVKKVQAPVAGVVADVLIDDGDLVKPHEVLIRFDMTATKAQLESLEQIRKSLIQENQFYRFHIGSSQTSQINTIQLKLPPEILLLIKNRANLVAENQLYQIQMTGSGSTGRANLTLEQQLRLRMSQAEFDSRVTASQEEVEQLAKQLQQTQIELANSRKLLTNDQNNFVTEQNNLAIEQQILHNLEPLVKKGAIAQIQYHRQEQEVGRRKVEVSKSQAEVSTRQAEVNRLIQEQQRINSEIAQAKAQLTNTIATTKTELQDKIALNQQSIADIDTQLGKQIIENDKKIAEIASQISQIKQNLKYQEIKAPVAGTVFELKAYPGFVPTSGQTVLEIVPNDALIAEVFIPNKDRGFVKVGMDVDVRVDSFDFSEFGDINGKLIWIGADALPPDEIHPYYRFSAKIQLEKQFIEVNGQETSLESGMSVKVNIKERKRRAITIFTGFLTKKLESLQQSR
ncbi:HlyD family efflux transporter periplasmic adaptor subunit [Pleurocapsales cyanobacterium LEGE 06147]|nr:HlyD family efflux transporter periplasmic adaptor subunit [Pleurocapsales cyanobacterium LEGE 06147]